jgi:two-component system sensor histidine kinase CpxA
MSSITIKLFLWFWLITLTSILVTRFISSQLTDENVVLPPHHDDIRQLKFFERRLKSFDHLTVETILRLRRKLSHDTEIWLKNTQSDQVVTTQKKPNKSVIEYLQQHSFTNIITVQFPQRRITGPITLMLESEPYQLFVAKKSDHPPLGMFILALPQWARIALPLTISFLLCWLLARTLIRPIKKLEQAATRIGSGDLSTRVTDVANRNDEIGELARQFNQMANQLSQSITAQQRLLGDVSHELRSPLTRLQLAIALAQKSQQPEQLQQYLARCEAEVTKLDQMITNVLKLSRLENALQNIDRQPTDLSHLLNMLCDDAQFLANEKHIHIERNITPNLVLPADQQLLASALSNIINNAVNYSPEHSVITVTAHQQGNDMIITVSDEGDGVPEALLTQLFEPFFRVDSARARSTGGTGLGLAITKQAVEAHNGRVIAKNNPDKGLTVTVKLPIIAD